MDLGAEFLRLDEGAAGERRAGDAGREAEIVLDPRARPGLAAIGARVENDDARGPRTPRRRRWRGRPDRRRRWRHRRRLPARARGTMRKRPRQRRLARIAEDGAVRDHDQRHVLRRRRVALDDVARLGVGRRVEEVMGMAVPVEEILEPGDGGRCRRADEHRAAGAGADQRDAAQDERAHDALAELGLGDQQRPEVLGRDRAAPRPRPRHGRRPAPAGRTACRPRPGTGPDPARPPA